ncbi:MAG: hypothetical protein KDF67_03605, partial [Ottowia sp.]|nr:hypothetical protein [Ottowia sp.]
MAPLTMPSWVSIRAIWKSMRGVGCAGCYWNKSKCTGMIAGALGGGISLMRLLGGLILPVAVLDL